MRRLFLLALIPACTTTSSSEVLTGEIYAAVNAETTGNGKTTVNVTLYVNNPLTFDFVKLDDGETLVAKSAGQSKTLAQREVLNTVVHRAELDGDGEGTIFEVAFDRDVDAGAPRSLAILPAKFELVAPPTTMSRAAALTFAWSPSGSADGMSLTASGDCIENYTAAITGDPGTVTVDANVVKKRTGMTIADECPVTFELRRAKPGTLDEHFRTGVIHGTQVRTATVTSTP